MIRTITLNSGFDDIYTVSDVVFGGVAELRAHKMLASGKGVNAARIAGALGTPVMAYALVGRADKELFSELLRGENINSHLQIVEASTRHNVTLISDASTHPSAHFRAPGFHLASAVPIARLIKRLRTDTTAGDVVTLNGSCPTGLGTGVWREIGEAAVETGARLVVDVQGQHLVEVLATLPLAVCKPNDAEMYDIPGVAGLPRWEGVRQALHYMRGRDVKLPVVTLGPDGVAFAADGKAWVATCRVAHPRLTVGAGDALAGALAAAIDRLGKLDADMVKEATAVASAFVAGTPLDHLPVVLDLFREQVNVRPLDDR